MPKVPRVIVADDNMCRCDNICITMRGSVLVQHMYMFTHEGLPIEQKKLNQHFLFREERSKEMLGLV